MKQCLVVFFGLFILMGNLFSTTWSTNSLKLAVLDFNLTVSNENIDPKIITELFQSELVNQGKFVIVERRQLEKVLSEKKLELSGLTESEQAAKIGSMMGAQKIVTGTISRMGTKYILIVKGIDSVTGEVDVSDQAMVSSIDKLLDSTTTLAARFTKRALGEKMDENIGDLSATNSSAVLEDSVMEAVNYKLDAMLDKKEFRNKKNIPKFQSLTKYLTKNEKTLYYQKYENKAFGYCLWNIIPFGVGSWIQGDWLDACIISAGLIAGGAIKRNENSNQFEAGDMVSTVAYLYGFIAPWIFSGIVNKQLSDSLLYDSRSANLGYQDNFVARDVNLFHVNMVQIQF